jgi:hypothetical protein
VLSAAQAPTIGPLGGVERSEIAAPTGTAGTKTRVTRARIRLAPLVTFHVHSPRSHGTCQ